MIEAIRLAATLVAIKFHEHVQDMFVDGILGSHWSWMLYPRKNAKYFEKKYGSVCAAVNKIFWA